MAVFSADGQVEIKERMVAEQILCRRLVIIDQVDPGDMPLHIILCSIDQCTVDFLLTSDENFQMPQKLIRLLCPDHLQQLQGIQKILMGVVAGKTGIFSLETTVPVRNHPDDIPACSRSSMALS